MRFNLITSLLLLSACVTEPLYVDEAGAPHYSVLCKASMDRCYRKAANLCGGQWETVEKNDERGVSVNSNPAGSNQYALLIKCKARKPLNASAATEPVAPAPAE